MSNCIFPHSLGNGRAKQICHSFFGTIQSVKKKNIQKKSTLFSQLTYIYACDAEILVVQIFLNKKI